MKNFVSFINAINKDPNIPKKAKYNTAILCPQLDTTEGMYRSLLPAYVLNSVDDIRLLVLGIRDKTMISTNEVEFAITDQMIVDMNIQHIVFPFFSEPLKPIIDEIRTINKNMKFSYHIDFNFYLTPDAFPFGKEYNQAKMIRNIEDNIKAVDQVIVTNKALKHYIADRFQEKFPDQKINTNVVWQPLFILPDLMKSSYRQTSKTPDKVKLLMIADDYQFSDMNYIRGILRDLKTKYKDALEIHIIGFDGKRGGKNYFSDLIFTHHKPVPFYEYFELIHHINPDLLLIPANVSSFNHTSKNYIKYLEAAHMLIPVIGPNIKPYAELITTNENGFLCTKKEDYFMQVESYFGVKEKFIRVPDLAFTTQSDYNIALQNNINILKSIYFIQISNESEK